MDRTEGSKREGGADVGEEGVMFGGERKEGGGTCGGAEGENEYGECVGGGGNKRRQVVVGRSAAI